MKKFPPLEVIAPIMFACVFMFTLIYSRFEPHVDDVDMKYIREHTGKPGYVLVDVRSEEVFDGESPMPGLPGGHIPGAISFPLEDLNVAAASAALAKVGVVKDSTVILYCNTGTAAGKFADALIRKFNFSPTKLKNYRGSIQDWVTYPENELITVERRVDSDDED